MRNLRTFLRSDEGSFAPAFALSIMPLLLALGIAVDYTAATTDRAQMQIDGRSADLSPGMSVTVEIKTGSRRIISYLLSPLIRYRQEILRER